MGAAVARKTQLLHAQSEPLIAERERASVARVALRVGKALDQFPCVLWPADFRPNYQGMERNPLSERSCRRAESKAGFYASSPLARHIADLRSSPTADQSPLSPRPRYLGASICDEFTRVTAPNPRMRPEKKPPDVERRPTTPPLLPRLRWSALATVGSSIIAEGIECIPFGRRARYCCSTIWITFRSRMHSHGVAHVVGHHRRCQPDATAAEFWPRRRGSAISLRPERKALILRAA